MKVSQFYFKTILVLMLSNFSILPAADLQAEKMPITTTSDQAYEYFLKGRDLLERLQAQESIKYFIQAVTEDSTFAMGYLYLSQVSPIVADFFANLEKAKHCLGTVSEGEKLWILGFDAGVNGYIMKQREMYNKLATLFPQDERVQNLLGAHHFGQQEYEKAIEHYRNAIAINQNFSAPYNQLGYAHRFLYHYPEAEKAFQKYIELIPNDPNPYDSYAELLMKMGKYDQSIEQYQKALTINPNFVASHIGIATNLNFKGQHAAARNQLKKLFDLARDDGERRAAYFAVVISYADEGKMNEALFELEKQYRIAEKTNDVASMAGDFNTMGNIYLEMGKFDEAAKRFEKSLTVTSNSTLGTEVKDNFYRFYLYNMARTDIYKNDLAAAETKTTEFCKLVEQIQNPFQMRLCHELKGMKAYAARDYNLAIDELQQANQQNPYILYRIALVYDGQKDEVKAKDYYSKAKNFNALNNLNYAFVRNLLK
jgi:tetratricopeptide (TPR) repeat protein